MLPGTGWVKGLSYGFLFWLALPFIGGMIGSALGSKPLARMTGGGSTRYEHARNANAALR